MIDIQKIYKNIIILDQLSWNQPNCQSAVYVTSVKWMKSKSMIDTISDTTSPSNEQENSTKKYMETKKTNLEPNSKLNIPLELQL